MTTPKHVTKPPPTQAEQQADYEFWWHRDIGARLNIAEWVEKSSVGVLDAAMILRGKDPADKEARACNEVQKLALSFEHHTASLHATTPRTLVNWRYLASKLKADYVLVVAEEIDVIAARIAAMAETTADAPSHALASSDETPMERRARRWQVCLDLGLPMPTDTYAQFPRGIGKVAKAENISRQALAQDLNAHRESLFGK